MCKASLWPRAAAVVAALFLCLPVRAVDYFEREPDNDSVPSPFLPGNPVFFSGDRLLGGITAGDSDNHFLTLDGSGAAGLYRYTFTLDTFDLPGGIPDSLLNLYDTTILPDGFGHQLGENDDYLFPGGPSRIVFDQFLAGGANPVFDVNIEGFPYDPPDVSLFDYALTIERALTPITDLGLLGDGITSALGTLDIGVGTWYSFTLGSLTHLSFDAFGLGLPEMALFDGAGNTIAGTDELAGAFFFPINGNFAAGTYYLAVGGFDSFYNWDALLQQPVGWDRSGFSGGFESFAFELSITATPTTIPEPGTLVLLGAGGLFLRRRRRAAGR